MEVEVRIGKVVGVDMANANEKIALIGFEMMRLGCVNRADLAAFNHSLGSDIRLTKYQCSSYCWIAFALLSGRQTAMLSRRADVILSKTRANNVALVGWQ